MEVCISLAQVSETSLSVAREQLRAQQVEALSMATPEQTVRLAMVATALELIHSCCCRVGDEAVREELSLLSAELVRQRAAAGVAGSARQTPSLTTSNAIAISLQLSERLAASDRPNLLSGGFGSGSGGCPSPLSAFAPSTSSDCGARAASPGARARGSPTTFVSASSHHRPLSPPPAARAPTPPLPPAQGDSNRRASTAEIQAVGALPDTRFLPTQGTAEFRTHRANAPASIAKANAHAHKSMSEAVSRYEFRSVHGPQMTSTHDSTAMAAAKERRRKSMAFGNQQSVANITTRLKH